MGSYRSSPRTGPAAARLLWSGGDRLTRQVERLERDLAISVEATALFIRYWLMVTPSVPTDFQAIAQAKGRERFASFLQMLGQRLATGQRVFQEVSGDVTFDASARPQK